MGPNVYKLPIKQSLSLFMPLDIEQSLSRVILELSVCLQPHWLEDLLPSLHTLSGPISPWMGKLGNF